MIQLSKTRRYLFSALSGLLMAISFPYTGSITPLIFVAWVPLLLVEESILANRYRSRKVFTHAYLAFLIYNLVTTWWIWNADSGGAIMAFVFNSFLMALAFQAYHFCKKNVGKKEGYIGLVIIWAAFEYLHYHWELSWPWLSIGNTFSIRPSWVQWYEYTGVIGGSIWVLIINLFIYRIVQNRFFKKESWAIQTPLFILLGILVAVPLTISLVRYVNYKDQGTALEVVVTQPNIDPYNEKFEGMHPADQLHRIANLADSLITDKTGIVLAPETAIPLPFDEAIFNYDPGYEILRDRMSSWGQTELYIGASTERRFDTKHSRASKPDYMGQGFVEYYNSSVYLKANNQYSIIHKSKLVLGAEKVPFSHWFPFLEELSLNLGGTRGTLGIEPEPRIFRNSNYAFAPVVCYESVYGEFVAEQCRKGAQAIFIITNDGWWDDTPGYKQHLSFARLRAIENRRSVARSANTGTSAFINQRGDVVQHTDWWKEDALKGNVYLNKHQTVYTRYGDFLGRPLVFVAFLLILLALVRKFKPSTSGKSV